MTTWRTTRPYWRPIAVALALSAFALGAMLADTRPATAQWGDSYDAPQYDPYGGQAPRRRARAYDRGDDYGYGGRAPRRYAPQPEPQRNFFWPWEGQSQQAQPQPQPQQQQRQAPRTTSRPVRPRSPTFAPGAGEPGVAARRRATPPPAVAQPKPKIEKTTPNTQVAVFGDSLASYLSKGLDDAFAENADVAVVDKSRGDSGIVRKDVVDWAKSADDYLKANPKTTYALFMVGVNDRQAIREGSESYEPLTDKWREIYAARVDAIVKVFVEHKIPLIWVDVPPVRFENMNKDLEAINELARERVQKAGQTYVDVWPGFVDEKNRFTAAGPDVDGQPAKLRAADGIHFTAAGARKVAHFAEIELKRLMGANGAPTAEQPAVSTAPASGTGESGGAASLDDTAAIDRKITAMLPSLPEPPGIPSLPVKPAAGPVVPLGRAETSPGGTLINARPRDGDALGTVERSLQRGIAPTTQPGRADDFKWPPG